MHEFFDDILSFTGGIPLYQEQLMKMAVKVGFTLDESEQLRRIVGKKKVKEVRKWKKKIKSKVKENKIKNFRFTISDKFLLKNETNLILLENL